MAQRRESEPRAYKCPAQALDLTCGELGDRPESGLGTVRGRRLSDAHAASQEGAGRRRTTRSASRDHRPRTVGARTGAHHAAGAGALDQPSEAFASWGAAARRLGPVLRRLEVGRAGAVTLETPVRAAPRR